MHQSARKEKQAVKDFITARNQKSNLNINGILEITIVANQNKIMVLKITYPY
jgi:hypothetical protein